MEKNPPEQYPLTTGIKPKDTDGTSTGRETLHAGARCCALGLRERGCIQTQSLRLQTQDSVVPSGRPTSSVRKARGSLFDIHIGA